MENKLVGFILVVLCLFASSCQTSETVLRQDALPTELTAKLRGDRVTGSMEGEQLRSFARKLAVRNASPSRKRQFANAEIVDSYLERDGDFIFLITRFRSQPIGNTIKVSTGLQAQTNSTYKVSL